MGRPCRFKFTRNKIIGIILTSMGAGMLLVLIVPWWGYILAFGLFIIGLFLLFV